MAIVPANVAQAQFQGLGAFGANEDYCDKKYPWGEQTDQKTGERLLDWNTKCKKSCSGFKCVSNPGLLAAPWTVVGKNARGLPDDSILGTLLANVKIGSGTKPPAAPKAPAGYFDQVKTFLTDPINLAFLGAAGLIGTSIYLKTRRKRRSFAGFSGYSRQHRRVRRTARKSKRS